MTFRAPPCIFLQRLATLSKTHWSVYVPPGLRFKILLSAHTAYLCILCGSQNKQRLELPTSALLYAVSSGNFLPKFRNTYRPQLEGSRIPLKKQQNGDYFPTQR